MIGMMSMTEEKIMAEEIITEEMIMTEGMITVEKNLLEKISIQDGIALTKEELVLVGILMIIHQEEDIIQKTKDTTTTEIIIIQETIKEGIGICLMVVLILEVEMIKFHFVFNVDGQMKKLKQEKT